MTEKDFADIINSTKSIVLTAVEKHLPPRFFHAIDDVVQETYMRAYRNLAKGSFRGDSTLSTWLYTIARNESLRMTKKLSREEEKFNKSLEKISEEPANSNNMEEELELLSTAIEELPVLYGDVMKRAYLGYNEKEIAKELDIKKGTVKSRLSRGREMLAKMIKEAKHENQ